MFEACGERVCECERLVELPDVEELAERGGCHEIGDPGKSAGACERDAGSELLECCLGALLSSADLTASLRHLRPRIAAASITIFGLSS